MPRAMHVTQIGQGPTATHGEGHITFVPLTFDIASATEVHFCVRNPNR